MAGVVPVPSRKTAVSASLWEVMGPQDCADVPCLAGAPGEPLHVFQV